MDIVTLFARRASVGPTAHVCAVMQSIVVGVLVQVSPRALAERLMKQFYPRFCKCASENAYFPDPLVNKGKKKAGALCPGPS
jgi:hypothetical protein